MAKREGVDRIVMANSPSAELLAASVAGLDGFLVTGGNGFLGRHLVARLRSLGKRVAQVSLSQGFDVTRDELPLSGVRHVFHLAGRTGIATAWIDPVNFFAANALGTMRVLDQCRRCGCSMTFASSFLYSGPFVAPAKETDPVEPQNPYALSKQVGEQVCAFYARQYGVNVATLRLANLYGPGQRTDFIIPHIVSQVIDQTTDHIKVWDLSPRRDFIHVDDAVDGILISMRAPPGSLFNLGTGLAYSVEEIILRTLAITGIDKPYRETGEKRRNDLTQAVLDVRAISAALAWQPAISLEAGLRSVIESMRGRCEP